MIDLATDALTTAFAVWPSFAGAFLLLSLALALAALPLNLCGARAARTVSALQGQVEAIKKSSSSTAAANARIEDLYRRNGTSQAKLGVSMLLALVGMVIVIGGAIVLLQVVHLLSAAGAGSLPRALDPASDLAAAVSQRSGRLLSLGLDFGASASTYRRQAASIPYVGVCVAFTFALAVRHRLANGTWRAGSIWAWILPLLIAQYLPVAILLLLLVCIGVSAGGTAAFGSRRGSGGRGSLTRSGRRGGRGSGGRTPTVSRTKARPRAAYRKRSEEAVRLDAAGEAERAAEVREHAIRSFIRDALAGELEKLQADVEKDCTALVARRPSAAAELYAELARRSARGVSPDCAATFLTRWIRSSEMTAFDRDWEHLRPLLAAPEGDLLDACRSSAPEISDAFVRQATGHFLRMLDGTVKLSATGTRERAAGGVAFELLDVLAPGRRPLTRADHYCLLGDMASRRGDSLEARLRYEEAARLGSPAANGRVAYALACEGYQLVTARRFKAAAEQLDAAAERSPEPEYDFLCAVAHLLAAPDPRTSKRCAESLDRLTGTGVPQPLVDFWAAIAYVLAGDAERATELLASADGLPDGEAGQWAVTDEALTLRAVLTGDDHAVVERARRLARSEGSWLEQGPSDPWMLLATTYRAEQDLFLDLMAGLPDNVNVPPWAAMAGAQASVARGLALARRGQLGEATVKLELADRLLAR